MNKNLKVALTLPLALMTAALITTDAQLDTFVAALPSWLDQSLPEPTFPLAEPVEGQR